MHAHADVAAVDTHGERLRLVTTPTTRSPVASVAVPFGDDEVIHLDVLAASHRIRLTGRDGRPVAHETVACGEAAGRPLASVSHWRAERRLFVLTAGTWRRPAAAIVACASQLRARLAVRTDAIVVDFPGEGALTALAAGPDGWRSWHVYPNPGDPHVVATRTFVSPERSLV